MSTVVTVEGWGRPLPPLTDHERATVEANTGLVSVVLRRRHTPNSEWDDSYQDGLLGLMRAAQLYDPTRGIRFSTYAYNWISDAVARGRRRLLGRSYRSAYDAGHPWHAPLSLDVPIGDGDTFGTLTLIDDYPGPDDQATDVALLAELAAHVDRMDLDRLDRIIAGEVLRPHGRAGDRAIAARCGVSSEIIRRRRHRLQARLRDWALGGAA